MRKRCVIFFQRVHHLYQNQNQIKNWKLVPGVISLRAKVSLLGVMQKPFRFYRSPGEHNKASIDFNVVAIGKIELNFVSCFAGIS